MQTPRSALQSSRMRWGCLEWCHAMLCFAVAHATRMAFCLGTECVAVGSRMGGDHDPTFANSTALSIADLLLQWRVLLDREGVYERLMQQVGRVKQEEHMKC